MNVASIETAISWAVATAYAAEHGYSQINRNGPDYDCSSFVATALASAGFDIAKTNTTRTLYASLLAIGFEEVDDVEVKRGDIFLTPGKHVVLAINDDNIVHASQDERGGSTGEESGDQTGKEICVRCFYTPSYGWQYHMRLNEGPKQEKPKGVFHTCYEVLRGAYGNGEARVERLAKDGWDYDMIQTIVNYICRYGDDFIDTVYCVIDGYYGNGDKRKEMLQAEGYDPDKVQFAVNAVLKYG